MGSSESSVTGRTSGWDAVAEMPPSVKLVAKALEYNGRLTQPGIAEGTLLPPRTVRYALTPLEEAGVVESRFYSSDLRKRIYELDIE